MDERNIIQEWFDQDSARSFVRIGKGKASHLWNGNTTLCGREGGEYITPGDTLNYSPCTRCYDTLDRITADSDREAAEAATTKTEETQTMQYTEGDAVTVQLRSGSTFRTKVDAVDSEKRTYTVSVGDTSANLAEERFVPQFGTVGNGKVGHQLVTGEISGATLCGREVTRRTHTLVGLHPCRECDTVRASLTEGNDSETMSPDSTTTEGETMPPRTRKAAAKPADTEETAKPRSADEVTADIETALTAMETADSVEKVTALEGQIRADFLELTANKRAPLSMRLTEGLSASLERLSKPAAELATVTTKDWRTEMDGGEKAAQELFTAGVERIKSGAELGKKAADFYKEVGNVIFEGRLRLRYKGAPDLMARSQAARNLSADMFEEAKKGIDDDAVDLQEFHKSMQKGVNNRMGDILVEWLRALDESSDREVFDTTFPDIFAWLDDKGDTETKPSDAIREYYETAVGVSLTDMTRAERAALDRAKRKELEAKKEKGEELAPEEVAELTGEKPAPTAEERVTAGVSKATNAAKAAKALDLDAITAIDETKRKSLRESLGKDIEALTALYVKLGPTTS